MNCKNAQPLLSAYIDDELSGREMLDLRAHLDSCAECSEELRCVGALRRLLGSGTVPEPSADFEDRLVSRVLAATETRVEVKTISLLALTGIAAASMLGTMLLMNTFRAQPPATAHDQERLPYELLQQDRMVGASSNPLMASPVLSRR